MTKRDQDAACAAAIDQMHDILATGRFSRGDVVAMLVAILTEAMKGGAPAEREALLAVVIGQMRQLWAEADARAEKSVM